MHMIHENVSFFFPDDFFTDRSNEENSEIVDLMDTSQQLQIQHEQYPSSSASGTNKKLAKHSDETSSYEIQRTRSGSNTPHQAVAETCDPRISQGMEILQRYIQCTYFFRQNGMPKKVLFFSFQEDGRPRS